MIAGIEVEVLKSTPEELHIFPRESRRGKAQWAIWVQPDGSGVLFIGNEQVALPKNGQRASTRGLELKRDSTGQLSLQ